MRFRFACYLIMIGFLGGCLGSREFTPVRYYSIDTLSASAPQVARSWPVSLGIRPFTAATRYRDRILYRLSEVEVGFYQYDRWVDPPEEMVARVVASTVRGSGLFRQVVPVDGTPLPTWILDGELMRFDDVRAKQSRAECWLRVELWRAHDAQLLWSDVLKAAVPLSTETSEALAQAMSRAVQHIAIRLVRELERATLPPS
jgi:ABC-type uncharacterized transport system auxiliary subunit